MPDPLHTITEFVARLAGIPDRDAKLIVSAISLAAGAISLVISFANFANILLPRIRGEEQPEQT